MATIEERAIEVCDSIPYDVYIHSSVNCEDSFKDGYIQGATDTINKVKDICEKWQKVYLHKATSPSPYSRQIAPEQFNAVNNVLVEVLKEFGVYPEEEEEE